MTLVASQQTTESVAMNVLMEEEEEAVVVLRPDMSLKHGGSRDRGIRP